MIFDFSKEVNIKGIKIIFSNEEIESTFHNKIKATMLQSHSSNVRFVSNLNLLNENTDGIFTTNKNIYLEVKTADCLPIFFYNESPLLFGVIHAGWKGLKKGIINNAYKVIKNRIGDTSLVEVLIGPSISQKNYEVQDEFISYFGSRFIATENNKIFLDLKAVAKSQLKDLGITNIIDTEECTYENEHYHSYRRDRTSKRLIGWIYYE